MNGRWILLLLALGMSQGMGAQDDRPWWRNLFQQEDVPADDRQSTPETGVMEEVEATPEAEPLPVNPADSSAPEWGEDPAETALPVGGVQGTVSWHIPEDIAALDSAKASPEEIRIPGYRVQLFMGRLDSARALRQSLLEEEGWDVPVYVTPYPPLFGVTLGNFTERLSAHRAKEGLRRRFPTCLVVPLDLPLDAVYPVASDGAQDPQNGASHRD